MHQVTASGEARARETAASARPFPWASLESLTRGDAEAARGLRRWASAHVRLDEVARAMGLLVGAEVTILTRSMRRVASLGGAADGVAVVLAAPDDGGGGATGELGRGVLVEVESALAAALVARGVRRAAPRVVDASRAASPLLAGALGAVLVAVARRAHAHGSARDRDRPGTTHSAALRVLAAGPAPALARDLAALGGERYQATLTVTVDADAFEARVSIPRAIALRAPEPPWTSRALGALGDLPLALSLVAASTASTAAEVGALQRGDAWMPGDWALARTKSGTLTGPVLLAAPSSELGIRAEIVDDGRLVLRGDVEELAWAPPEGPRGSRRGATVSEAERSDALIEAVGEVPVVVRVEIGVAEMRAREWASLGRGDVIALGRRIGEPVTLRVGSVTVARGELVDIDGEIGVRILGREGGSEGPR